MPTLRANRKFFKAIGGILGKIGDDVLNRRFDTIMTLLPFLLVIGEMVADSEAREGAMLMFSSIASADDILAWAEYFRLPADGWDGDGEPPKVDTDGNAAVIPHFAYPFMGQAYATRKYTIRRIKGYIIGRTLAKVGKDLPNLSNNPAALSGAIREITKGMKGELGVKSLRKTAFSAFMVKTSVELMQKVRSGISTLLKGRPDQRVRQEILFASIVYLEQQMDNGNLFPSDSQSRIAVRELYARLFVKRPDEFWEKQYHGAAFHLMMLTYYHLVNQTAGQPEVLAIESVREFKLSDDGDKYAREVDIVLDLDGGKERHIELKSFKAPVSPNLLKHWTYLGGVQGGKHLHKEFSADTLRAVTIDSMTEYSWRFHSFVSRNKVDKGPRSRDIAGLKKTLCKPPVNIDRKWLREQTGLTPAQYESNCERNADVNVMHVKSIVNDFVNGGLFGDLGDMLEDLLSSLSEE